MPTPPPFPTQSLYGPMPGFPVNWIRIPNLIDLPKYILSVTTYYGNPMNYPYSHPPVISSWQIPYPNLLGIPSFLADLIIWLLGWVGAMFEWVFIWSSDQLINLFKWGIQTGNNEFQNLVNTSQAISNSTGIFQPLVLTIFLVTISAVAILITMAAANLIGRIT